MSMPQFDKDGYPSDASLSHLTGHNWPSIRAWLNYAKELWNHNYGRWTESGEGIVKLVELATGGWSGNESVVTAMRESPLWSVVWRSSHRGGLEELSFEEETVLPGFREAATMLSGVLHRMHFGCGNHGCRIKKPVGMATNGPCHCSAKYFIRDLLDVAEMIEGECE